MKIALLIPCTSKGRPWVDMKETYLYNLSLKTFLLTMNKEYEYRFYIGIDKNDAVFDNASQQNEIMRFSKVFPNVTFEFISMSGIKKGHLTKMWNVLFERAYEDNFDYFFQCGDDIYFATKGWVKDCILMLRSHDDIGLTGPINNNNRILTQAFVSRKHMEIFGWFFPEQIINWCCDDWYNLVYQPTHFFPLTNHFCSNNGGSPRYDVNNNPQFLEHGNGAENTRKLRQITKSIANEHRKLLVRYISHSDN